MALPKLSLALSLALLASCVLARPHDVGSQPHEHLVGGRQELSPDDPQVKKVAQAAVANYNMGSNSMYVFRDTKIIRATSQLVAGVKYTLTMDLGSTSCRKTTLSGEQMDFTTCPLAADEEQEKLRCTFEILVVPWKNSSQLLSHDCVNL
ncbi:cystatin-M [Suncus etruscus]|uniref:cystatin-M n=1 Tax=Suncus etruscus TaxID=109475 RepID=UPI00210FD82D|nr:cystatin-M [Suncus etruscus]